MDVNSRDADGNTLLMQTALYGTAADLDFLLAHGADVNAANQAGHTALMRAMPDLAKIRLLVEHGADVNVSAGGTTPLLIAAGIRSAEDVVRYLIEKGADVKAIDIQGADAVMIAAFAGATGNLKILLDARGERLERSQGTRVSPATARCEARRGLGGAFKEARGGRHGADERGPHRLRSLRPDAACAWRRCESQNRCRIDCFALRRVQRQPGDGQSVAESRRGR